MINHHWDDKQKRDWKLPVWKSNAPEEESQNLSNEEMKTQVSKRFKFIYSLWPIVIGETRNSITSVYFHGILSTNYQRKSGLMLSYPVNQLYDQ